MVKAKMKKKVLATIVAIGLCVTGVAIAGGPGLWETLEIGEIEGEVEGVEAETLQVAQINLGTLQPGESFAIENVFVANISHNIESQVEGDLWLANQPSSCLTSFYITGNITDQSSGEIQKFSGNLRHYGTTDIPEVPQNSTIKFQIHGQAGYPTETTSLDNIEIRISLHQAAVG